MRYERRGWSGSITESYLSWITALGRRGLGKGSMSKCWGELLGEHIMHVKDCTLAIGGRHKRPPDQGG